MGEKKKPHFAQESKGGKGPHLIFHPKAPIYESLPFTTCSKTMQIQKPTARHHLRFFLPKLLSSLRKLFEM